MSDVGIVRVRDEPDREAVRGLVWEFLDFLRARYPERHAQIDAYTADQDIEGQLADFEAHFLPPHGECFLALKEGGAVGIVMIRPRADGNCEMNRMYVTPEARGLKIGRKLGQAAVAEARALGYPAVILGALDRHVEALPLYGSLGFVRFKPDGGHGADDPGVVHMRLDLQGAMQ